MKKIVTVLLSTALLLSVAIPTLAVGKADVGCVARGRGYVGQLPNPGNPNGPDWFVSLHASHQWSRCNPEMVLEEGDWNVQTLRGPDGEWESYKSVFTSEDLSATGARLYWENIQGDLDWWLIQAMGDSPYLEPLDGATHAVPAGVGLYH